MVCFGPLTEIVGGTGFRPEIVGFRDFSNGCTIVGKYKESRWLSGGNGGVLRFFKPMARYLPIPWVMFGKTRKSPNKTGD